MATLIVEDLFVEKWIYAQLSNSTALTSSVVGNNIFNSTRVPQGSDGPLLPCVRFFRVSSDDKITQNGNRVFNELFYQVEVCDKANSKQHLTAAVVAVDVALHKRGVNQIVTVDGIDCMVLYSIRRDTMNRELIDNNERHQFIGGVYAIAAQSV